MWSCSSLFRSSIRSRSTSGQRCLTTKTLSKFTKQTKISGNQKIFISGGTFGCLGLLIWNLNRQETFCEEKKDILSIIELEQVHPGWKCSNCQGNEAYLDAAPNVIRCTQCDTPVNEKTKANKETKNKDIINQKTLLVKSSKENSGLYNLGNGSFVVYFPSFFSSEESINIMEKLNNEVAWEQHLDILADGKVVLQPRLIAYQAQYPEDKAYIYQYPNISRPLIPTAFSPTIIEIREKVEKATNTHYDSVHLNLYRTGSDHISWHSDEDVPLYGPEPNICSVSFGAEREFILRKIDDHDTKITFTLSNGDVLVMKGTTQKYWEHSVKKNSATQSPRINITLRKIMTSPPN
eukprot:c10187_g1_i1.p1 GENE.c10187_g1_i1~~c10187_g1_i1.p1  ORF type:complete len:363 (+),score=137.50 c10187_g1_i1:40-1089(+)